MASLLFAHESCGIQFGLYLSPWDRNSKLYGTTEYNDYFLSPLTELLTEYGLLFYVWFDNGCGEGPNGKIWLSTCPKCGGGMRIISFIDDEATIKKTWLHLTLWLPQTNDPPQEEPDHTTLPIHPHRSYEWWEAINQVSGNAYSENTRMQSPYEDKYAQLVSCAY